MKPEEPRSEALERCMELFALHQRRLYLYVSALIPSPADADEVLHETNIVIWKKFDQFEPGTDFLTWAFRIAHYQALEQRRKKAQSAPGFSLEVMEQLAGKAIEQDADLEHRRAALIDCRKKLGSSDRDILERCYAPNARVTRIANEMGKTATSLYRSLRRIRQLLTDCVRRTLAAEA